MIDTFEITQTLDTSGTRCPIPLLRAKQALKTMQSGQYLKVLSTDPGAKPDFEAMLSHLPHELVEYSSGSGDENTPRIDTFIIRKGG